MNFKRKLRALLLPIQFRAAQLLTINESRPIVASYVTTNWGDAFNIELGTRLFESKPLIADLDTTYRSRSFEEEYPDPWFLIGSILQRARPQARVWGSGLMTPSPPRPAPRPLAVRGKLTRHALESVGVFDNPPLGDPGLLIRYMPELAPDTSQPINDIGLIPHYSDLTDPSLHTAAHQLNAPIINIRSDTRTIINAVARCKIILSSSLHGLIIAHALGVPYVWISIGNRIGGGHFKFHDFFSTCQSLHSAIDQRPIPLTECSHDSIAGRLHHPTPIDLRPMIEAFPFHTAFLDKCHRLNSADLEQPELSRCTSA